MYTREAPTPSANMKPSAATGQRQGVRQQIATSAPAKAPAAIACPLGKPKPGALWSSTSKSAGRGRPTMCLSSPSSAASNDIASASRRAWRHRRATNSASVSVSTTGVNTQAPATRLNPSARAESELY
jgi:hypothetical protein